MRQSQSDTERFFRTYPTVVGSCDVPIKDRVYLHTEPAYEILAENMTRWIQAKNILWQKFLSKLPTYINLEEHIGAGRLVEDVIIYIPFTILEYTVMLIYWFPTVLLDLMRWTLFYWPFAGGFFASFLYLTWNDHFPFDKPLITQIAQAKINWQDALMAFGSDELAARILLSGPWPTWSWDNLQYAFKCGAFLVCLVPVYFWFRHGKFDELMNSIVYPWVDSVPHITPSIPFLDLPSPKTVMHDLFTVDLQLFLYQLTYRLSNSYAEFYTDLIVPILYSTEGLQNIVIGPFSELVPINYVYDVFIEDATEFYIRHSNYESEYWIIYGYVALLKFILGELWIFVITVDINEILELLG